MSLRVIFWAGQLYVHNKAIQLKFICNKKFFVQIKKNIIDFLANLKLSNNPFFLFPVRINPEFIHQQAHTDWLGGLLYKAYVRMSSGIVPIHPTAKAVGILGMEL